MLNNLRRRFQHFRRKGAELIQLQQLQTDLLTEATLDSSYLALQQFAIKPATRIVDFKDVKKADYLKMAAYSIDLRQKILSAWQNKEGTQRELAKRFKVSLSFIRDFLRRYRETNELTARPQGGDRRSKLKSEEQELLKTMVNEQSDIYLRELQAALQERKAIEVSLSSLSRTLKRLKLKRKKKL